jgi:hypothetical protein
MEVVVSCSPKNVAVDYGQTWHNILEEHLQMRAVFVCPEMTTTTTTTTVATVTVTTTAPAGTTMTTTTTTTTTTALQLRLPFI